MLGRICVCGSMCLRVCVCVCVCVCVREEARPPQARSQAAGGCKDLDKAGRDSPSVTVCPDNPDIPGSFLFYSTRHRELLSWRDQSLAAFLQAKTTIYPPTGLLIRPRRPPDALDRSVEQAWAEWRRPGCRKRPLPDQ